MTKTTKTFSPVLLATQFQSEIERHAKLEAQYRADLAQKASGGVTMISVTWEVEQIDRHSALIALFKDLRGRIGHAVNSGKAMTLAEFTSLMDSHIASVSYTLAMVHIQHRLDSVLYRLAPSAQLDELFQIKRHLDEQVIGFE